MTRTIDPRQLLDLTAHIYDALEEPSRWVRVLDELAQVFLADGAGLFHADAARDGGHGVIAVGAAAFVKRNDDDSRLESGFDGKAGPHARLEVIRLRGNTPFAAEERQVFALIAAHMGRALAFQQRLAVRGGGPGPAALSPRQREVLTLGSQGLRSKEIAARLGLAVRTVEHHFTAAAERLETRGRSQTIALALDLGLISSQPTGKNRQLADEDTIPTLRKASI